MGIQKPYSEETGKLIDNEVRKLVSEAYQRTLKLLQQNIISLKSVAELLLKKEVIFKEDLEYILGKRTGKHLNIESAVEKITEDAII
jgi:cell division protease FtsH